MKSVTSRGSQAFAAMDQERLAQNTKVSAVARAKWPAIGFLTMGAAGHAPKGIGIRRPGASKVHRGSSVPGARQASQGLAVGL
jgi:hypothetical protein